MEIQVTRLLLNIPCSFERNSWVKIYFTQDSHFSQMYLIRQDAWFWSDEVDVANQ